MNSKKEAKLEVLRAIKEEKTVFFGAFSDTLTKADKFKKWGEIHAKATALGLVPASKDIYYTRDVFWQNTKKNTMKKVDNRRKTGTGGGADSKMNDIDYLVCEIIGKDSPLIEGLPVKESWDVNENIVTESEGAFQSTNCSELIFPSDTSPSISAACQNTSSSTRKLSRQGVSDETEDELRMKKLRLSIELMEREKYLKDLQILQMERLLTIPPSEFTANYHTNFTYEVIEDEEYA